MLTEEEIEQRKPLWEAFSEVWLDTELQNYDFENIVDLMLDSKLSIETLNIIFESEVAPVVYKNLFSAVGVWDGFDKVWLFEKIIENIHKQEQNALYRKWINSRLGNLLLTKMVQDDWKRITELYKKKYPLTVEK
jgi:hypothetical protein